MDKKTYLALNTEDKVQYLNSEMTVGKSLFKICEDLNLTDNVIPAFNTKGYVRNAQGLFIKREEQQLAPVKIDQIPKPTEVDMANPTNGGSYHPEPKRIGRPPRKGNKPKKLTIEIDQDVYKALMHYKIDKGLYVNSYIEDLLRTNLPEKYFRSL